MRPWPAVRQHQRPAAVRLAANVNEMDVQILDASDKLWVAIQSCYSGAPIKAVEPVTAQSLQELRVATQTPAATRGGRRQLALPHAAQNARHIGGVPLDLEWIQLNWMLQAPRALQV